MSIIIDIFVVLVLATTIIFCVRLNRKLALMQSSKKELAFLFANFDQTIIKAQKGITELKTASEQATVLLQKRLDKAAMLIDELTLLNQRGEVVAKKIQDQIGSRGKENLQNANATPSTVSDNKVIPLPTQNNLRENKEKLLHDLLQEISRKKSGNANSDNDAVNDAGSQQDGDTKIANMLKSLGYGNNTK